MKECVNAIIFNKNRNQVLIIQRRDVPVWVIPGGAIDENETPEQSVLREVEEETGLKVSIKRKVGTYKPINRLTAITHLFECEKISGTPTTGDETRNIGFFPLEALPKTFFHVHKDMICDSLDETQEAFDKTLTQVTYWELTKYFLKHPLRVIRFLLSQAGIPINYKG